MKIAIFLPNWIGDVVMATPTLRAVRNRYASAELIGVMRPYVADVLAGTTWLDEKLYYDPRSQDPALKSRQLVRQLRKRHPDTVLLLTNSLRTGLLGWLSGAPQRVGYAQYGRGGLLTDKLKFPKMHGKFVPSSTMDSYLRLAYLLGCREQHNQTELSTLPEDDDAADRAWERLRLPAPDQVVVCHNAGGWNGKASSKSWPAESMAELLRRIANHLNLSVLVMCGPNERADAANIALLANHPNVKSLADQPLSIGLTKACVRRSRLMVSTDSGPRHFAAAFGVPVVSLYGPTHIAWGNTHFSHEIHLQHDVPCGPCMKRVCPLKHHNCMRDLTVDRVFDAVVQQLGTQTQPNAA
ncbi:MAG: lipopolysaccharide heptosyltransferase II [Planctomycetales bacterium]